MNKGEKLEKVTLVIPTHNRINYLKRILDYYEHSSLKIIIADSSKEPFPYAIANRNVEYYHWPDVKLPKKLFDALQRVKTKFVVMCADDDFTFPDSIQQCVNFLEQNETFAVAQGNVLTYLKDTAKAGRLEFSILYKNMFSFSIETDDAMDRVGRLLRNYRSVFYAVHYTVNLQFAFEGVSQAIQNLYLNEYVTVIPLIKGNYAELPILFQVREFSSDSGDKVTINLDQMLENEMYSDEVESFFDLLTLKVSHYVNNPAQIVKDKLREYFKIFCQRISESKALSFKKRVGNVVSKLPVVGKKMIRLNRRLEAFQKQNISLIVRTEEEKQELNRVSDIILKHTTALA
jgi:glycosyltransferase domain-containing protein